MIFVALKNSSRPMITCQSASTPTSRMSGTSVYRISDTPPPKAVAERCRTRSPASFSESVRISSMRGRPTRCV